MATWLFVILVAVVLAWGFGIIGGGGRRRAPSRLNNQGLPRPFDRGDHRQNDEE